MADVGYELMKLAVLSQGRNPVFVAQDEVGPETLSGPPDTATAGVDIEDAIVAVGLMRLREDASTRTCKVTVTTVDDSATYTVTLAGEDFDYAAGGGDEEADILAGLQAEVDASDDFSAEVVGTELVISGASEDDYTARAGATGTGELAIELEASRVEFRVWLQPNGRTDWFAHKTFFVHGNWTERFVVSGFDRMFLEVTDTNGTVTPSIGPCGMES